MCRLDVPLLAIFFSSFFFIFYFLLGPVGGFVCSTERKTVSDRVRVLIKFKVRDLRVKVLCFRMGTHVCGQAEERMLPTQWEDRETCQPFF